MSPEKEYERLVRDTSLWLEARARRIDAVVREVVVVRGEAAKRPRRIRDIGWSISSVLLGAQAAIHVWEDGRLMQEKGGGGKAPPDKGVAAWKDQLPKDPPEEPS